MQSAHFREVFCFYINDYGKSGGLVLDKMQDLLEHVFVDISVSFFLMKISEKRYLQLL